MNEGTTIEAEIGAIGSQGDGIAETAKGRLHVPLTVPGDRVRLTLRKGKVAAVERLADGPARVEPPCPHFTVCGGCALQHVRDAEYAAWKRDRVTEALARRGLDVAVGELIRTPPEARRRVRLGAKRLRRGVVLGFKERRSHQLVNVAACPVALPGIVGVLPGLREVLVDALPFGATAEISVTMVATGLDIAVETAAPLDLDLRERLAAFADAADLARLGWGDGPVAQRRSVRVAFAGIEVDLPPGAFLQPSDAGEAALSGVVTDALSDCASVADLYAGCGAFVFALAASGKSVTAFESEPALVAAIDAASRRAGSSVRVAVAARDLRRRPLDGKELKKLDGLVLDPPRAGAAEQTRALAESPIPVIAYVSCNPASFARDARTLVDGGYRLEAVTPVDQFLWSPHVELAAVFRR